MKYLISFILVFQMSVMSIAQSAFSCDPDSVIVEKSINFDLFYDYTQFENHTDDTLLMRWKKVYLYLSDGHGGIVNWGVTIQDPNTFYSPASATDSADFFLPPTTTSTDKFLVQVYPNGMVGNMRAQFLFYPINNPSDTGSVFFDYTTTITPTTVQHFSDGKVEVMPNPAFDFFQIKNETKSEVKIQLLDVNGKIWLEDFLAEKSSKNFFTENVASGIYFLVVEKKSEKLIRKILIQK